MAIALMILMSIVIAVMGIPAAMAAQEWLESFNNNAGGW